MKVESHINKLFSSVSYLIRDAENRNSLIIDPGDVDDILSCDSDKSIKAILLTHIHYDHIYGLKKIHERFPEVPVYTNEAGFWGLKDEMENLSFFHDSPFRFEDDNVVRIVKPGEKVNLTEELSATAVFTPGHHPSCISWIIGENIFTGDAYIPGEKVVTKLQGGDKKSAKESVKKILLLSEDRRLFPGHSIKDKKNG